MKLIVGLGNPGQKYEYTRHNAGFLTVDALSRLAEFSKHNFQFSNKFEAEILQTKEVILVKPQTFMNDSGRAVAAITRFYKVPLTNLFVVHDDLDITLGNYKIQHGKGPQVHNGLLSIEDTLGSDKFWNVRIGVENREVRGNKGIPGVEYSLQNFRPDERVIIETIIIEAANDLLTRVS